MAGARFQAHSTGERCINRALVNRLGRMKGQMEGEWVEVAFEGKEDGHRKGRKGFSTS